MSSLECLIEMLRKASIDLKRVFGDRFVGLMLFGSYARGEASESSDVDVLVVLRDLRELRVRGEIYKVISEHVGKPLTLIDLSLEELLRDDLEVTPLLLNALYDGIIIYDETGILEKLKGKVLELISKAQLVRYKTPDGRYGWKRVDGKPLEVVEV